MTATRKILLAIASFFGLIFLIALFLPSRYNVEREITVNAPYQKVFEKTIDFANRFRWDPWITSDSTAVIEYRNVKGYIGSTYSWRGKKIGEGLIEITSVKPPDSFEAKLTFLKPNRMKADITWMFFPSDSATVCKWKISGDLSYPANRIFGLFIDDILGSSMERGLKNLKNHLKKND